MLNPQVQEALNAQVNAELYSWYLYLSMAAYFEAESLSGFANWMRIQAGEEMTHAMKFYDFIVARNGRVTLKPIDGPATTWASPLAVFEEAYQHEQKVTGLIHQIADLALKEADHATHSFLKWFIDEQVEEEASADRIVQDLRRAEGSGVALLLLDREMAQRTAAPAEGEGAA